MKSTLTNCTFSGNSAYSGGAMVNSFSSSTLTNCIIWGNGGSPIYNGSDSTPMITFSDIQGGYTGAGNIDADPLFVRNPSAGADGVWGTADDDYGDLRLRADSPCIDAGSNAAVPAGITTDLAGKPRFVDVPGANDPGAIVDMGAYERQLAVSIISGSFLFDAPRPAVQFSLSDDIDPASLSASDLVLQNVTTAETIDTGALATISYDAAGHGATWSFNSSLLMDGSYRATLPASAVTDISGERLAADFSFDFFVLTGDANRDRKVDITDLGILATNWQAGQKKFSEADFDYDTIVDITDLGFLATNWQKDLPAPAARAPLPFAGARAGRVIELVELTTAS
jgi:hypothetical protein